LFFPHLGPILLYKGWKFEANWGGKFDF